MVTKDSPHQCSSHDRSCVSAAATILNKWTPQLVYAMANGTCRFCELQKALGGVNPRTLSARLDELEQARIITKRSFNEMPPRIEYELTKKGHDLLPILEQMVNWGNKYSPKEPVQAL